ncbi:AF4/FMR2 family member 1-like isoform X2 [Macrobrachium nipponense]|uniref:AF4/FMR2 family member 1-like isoform X2 n=1 Tax=Macrobrachium nipponense TaxID=159736 RepID=UPI0030C7B1DB
MSIGGAVCDDNLTLLNKGWESKFSLCRERWPLGYFNHFALICALCGCLTSMPRENDLDKVSMTRDREFEKQRARKMRESMANMASSSSKEQEPQGRFELFRRSTSGSTHSSKVIKNHVEKILGSYDNFKTLGGEIKTSLLGVYQQPPTPIASREPIHDPDSYPPILPPPQTNIMPMAGSSSSSSSSSSKPSQRSLPAHHSSRNGTTRPPKSLPPTSKPPHPPSHTSQHSQPRNGEVKGNLKSGPSSGPGDGGGNKFTLMGKPPNLPPLKLASASGGGGGGAAAAGGDGEGEDALLQRIRSEMSVKNPVSAIIQTPRPDHSDGNFPFSALTPIKDTPLKDTSSKSSRRGDDHAPKFNKPSEISSLKGQKPIDRWNVKADLPLSEESEDEQVGGTHSSESQLQSSVVGSSNSKPLLSPISTKTSEDSSSEDDSTDDSEVSSNSEDEQPASEPSSPKGQGGDKSPNPWKLEKYIPTRKIKSPSSQETVTPGPPLSHPEDDPPPVDKPPLQSQRKRDRRNSKVVKSAGSHRGSRHTHEPVVHSDDSSDVGESHRRPTLRAFPQLRQSKVKSSRRVNPSHHDSDSDSDPGRPSKSDSNQSTVTPSSSLKDLSKLPDKTRKSNDTTVARDNTRRTPKKRTDSKDNQNGAKSETVKSKRSVKSREYIPCDLDSDSDSIIDVENATPLKQPASQRSTPSRTAKEFNHISSPVKAHQLSPHVSPMPPFSSSNKSSSRRTPLSEASSEPANANKSEDLFGRSQGNSEKGPLVNSAFTLDKDNKKGRDRDPVEKDSRRRGKAHRETSKNNSGTCSSSSDSKDRSKIERSKGVSESSPLDNRLSGRPGVSPLVDKSSESPIVSPEPKVPISQLHHEFGSRKFTCTIPLSLIDKVPKPNINSVPCILKTELKEEDKKEVLDNRTTGKGGKGKRKTGDPNAKESCTEDNKARVISSIFRVRRPDSENDNEKAKKEQKSGPIDSDDSDNEKMPSKSTDSKVKEEEGENVMARPSSVRQRSSPMPSSLSDTSSSRTHRKKKRDSVPERSPSSHERKKPRCNSERLAPEYSTLNSVGDTNSLDSCDVHSRLRGTGGESDHSTSRKRDRERESSLESTRSSSHSESGRTSKKPRISKSKDMKDSSMKSPSIRPGSQRESSSSRAWSQEKDLQQNLYPQRPQPSQQSSQGKVDESHATPGTEHDTRVDGASFRSNGDQTVTTSDGNGETPASEAQQENGTPMVPPQSHKQASVFSTGVAMGSAQSFPDQSSFEAYYLNLHKRFYPSYFERKVMPENNVDYMGFLSMAKDLKHTADAEADRSVQVMKYLEAALYFILSGKAMENDPKTEESASLRIYKDTLNFIRHVSSIVMREKQDVSLDNRLAVISLRCQSLLSLQIYRMIRHEYKDIQRQLSNYVNNYGKHGSIETTSNAANPSTWGGHRTSGSPSHLSQTPSPAGSVGSEGSQSSGYNTSTEGARTKNGPPPVGHTPPHPQPPPGSGTVPVPQHIHTLFMKQHQYSFHLATAHDLWTEADNYVFKNDMQEFFIELDHLVSPLTLHSSLSELVYYVQCGLQRLKD